MEREDRERKIELEEQAHAIAPQKLELEKQLAEERILMLRLKLAESEKP